MSRRQQDQSQIPFDFEKGIEGYIEVKEGLLSSVCRRPQVACIENEMEASIEIAAAIKRSARARGRGTGSGLTFRHSLGTGSGLTFRHSLKLKSSRDQTWIVSRSYYKWSIFNPKFHS